MLVGDKETTNLEMNEYYTDPAHKEKVKHGGYMC